MRKCNRAESRIASIFGSYGCCKLVARFLQSSICWPWMSTKKCHRRKNQRKILVQHGAFNNDLGSPGLQNSSSMTPELSPTSWLSRCWDDENIKLLVQQIIKGITPSPENPVVKSFPAPRVLDKKKSGQHRKILVGKDQGWMPLLGHWTHPCHSFPSRRAASKLHATIWSNVGIVLPAWREDIMLQRKFFSLKYREICKPGTSSQTEYTLQVQIYIYQHPLSTHH